MKKIMTAALLSAALLAPTFAQASVSGAMQQMAYSYRSIMRDNSLSRLKVDLRHMKAGAEEAKKSAWGISSSMRPTYRQGINILIKQIDVAQRYANEGNFRKAKDEAAKLRYIMAEYHRKMGL